MIKAVLFDAGGTLLAPKPSVGHVYAEVAAKHKVKADPADLNTRFRAAWKKQKAQRRLMDKEWWREVVFAVFEEKLFAEPDAFFDDVYHAFTEPTRWKIFPDVLPVLKELRGKKLSLAIASNWDNRLPKLLRDLSLSPHFDHQFVSALIGQVKPNPAFFQHALNMLGLEPNEVLHVGDDAVEDVSGAMAVGIKSVLLNRSAAKDSGDTINSLLGLVRLV